MADLLIRGVDMPTNCFDCSTKINPDERRCNYDGHIFEETLSKITTRRDENCPLVEVPAHGELVDRDKLLALMSDEIIQRGGDERSLGIAWAQSAVEVAPTVIEASEEEQDG